MYPPKLFILLSVVFCVNGLKLSRLSLPPGLNLQEVEALLSMVDPKTCGCKTPPPSPECEIAIPQARMIGVTCRRGIFCCNRKRLGPSQPTGLASPPRLQNLRDPTSGVGVARPNPVYKPDSTTVATLLQRDTQASIIPAGAVRPSPVYVRKEEPLSTSDECGCVEENLCQSQNIDYSFGKSCTFGQVRCCGLEGHQRNQTLDADTPPSEEDAQKMKGNPEINVENNLQPNIPQAPIGQPKTNIPDENITSSTPSPTITTPKIKMEISTSVVKIDVTTPKAKVSTSPRAKVSTTPKARVSDIELKVERSTVQPETAEIMTTMLETETEITTLKSIAEITTFETKTVTSEQEENITTPAVQEAKTTFELKTENYSATNSTKNAQVTLETSSESIKQELQVETITEPVRLTATKVKPVDIPENLFQDLSVLGPAPTQGRVVETTTIKVLRNDTGPVKQLPRKPAKNQLPQNKFRLIPRPPNFLQRQPGQSADRRIQGPSSPQNSILSQKFKFTRPFQPQSRYPPKKQPWQRNPQPFRRQPLPTRQPFLRPPQQPRRPNRPPVRPKQQPPKPNQSPVKPNQPPVKPNQPPVKQNQLPVKPNQPPIRTNQPPIRTNQPPIRTNQPPIRTNKSPIRPNQPSIKTNQPPVRPNQQPIRTNQPPIRTNQPLIRTNQPLIRANQSPVRPNQQPNRPIQEPMKSNLQPPKPNQQPVRPNQQPARINQQSLRPNQPQSRLNQPPIRLNQPPIRLNQQSVRPIRPNQPPIRPSGQPVRPNQPQIRPNQPPTRPNRPTIIQNQQPGRPNQPPVRPNQTPVRPNQPPFRPNQQPPRPDQQQLNPGQENVSSTQQQIDRSDNIDKLFYAESVQNTKFFQGEIPSSNIHQQRKHQQTHVYKPYNQEYTNKKPTLTTEQPIPIYQTSNPSHNSRPTRIPYSQPTHNHGSHPRYPQKQQQSFFGKISSSASGLWNSLG